MLETTSNLSINENQSESYVSKQQISLPVIGRRHNGEQIHNKSYQQKQKLVLPNIHKNRLATQSPNSIKSDSKRKNHQQFAKAVRQKLDLVLGQMPEYQTAEQDMQNSEDEDFEDKINQNKEIIKRHRLKKEKENQNSPKSKRGDHQLKQRLQKKLRNESMQIKKDKIIQNNSLKKRNLSKRTSQPKEKGGYYQSPALIGESQKQIRLRDEYNSVKLNKNNNGDKLKKNKIERAKSYKKSVKPLLDINKSLNLFDGIQNILQNPHKKEAMKGPIGLTLMKARRDLEDKIKIINQKLGVEESQQNNKKMLIKSMDLRSSERQWRKIQIGPQNVHTQNSSFEQELARISSLQEKNSLCFEKYLEHQKILLELQMRQRTLTRKDHTNSH